LDQEAAADDEYRSKYEDKWQLPLSLSVNAMLVNQGSILRETLDQARRADVTLTKKIEEWEDIITLLSSDEVFYHDCIANSLV